MNIPTATEIAERCAVMPTLPDWRHNFCLGLNTVSGVTESEPISLNELQPVFDYLLSTINTEDIRHSDLEEMFLFWLRNFETGEFRSFETAGFIAFVNLWQQHLNQDLTLPTEKAVFAFLHEVVNSKRDLDNKLDLILSLRKYCCIRTSELPKVGDIVLESGLVNDVIEVARIQSGFVFPTMSYVFENLELVVEYDKVGKVFARDEPAGLSFNSQLTGKSVNHYTLSYLERILILAEGAEKRDFKEICEFLKSLLKEGKPSHSISARQVASACEHLLQVLLFHTIVPNYLEVSTASQIFALAYAMQQCELITNGRLSQIRSRVENHLKVSDRNNKDSVWTVISYEYSGNKS